MSFADIESGRARPPTSLGAPSDGDAFSILQSSLALQVFKINANVQGILKLVDQLGTSRDNAATRKGLHDLTETTRQMAKRGSDDLKKLSTLVVSDKPAQKTALQKTSHDFQLAFVAFQRAQKLSAERQRTVVDTAKQAAVAAEQDEAAGSPATSPQQQQLQQQVQLAPAINAYDLAHQEGIIQEREQEIREIESGIHELHEIFRDMATLVNEQGEMIDNIESNISSVAIDTGNASEELVSASDYQRKAGRRAACLMIVLVIVVAVVLLAVKIGLRLLPLIVGIPV